MKYFSLFSGIGGFELGIQQAYEIMCTKNKEQRIQGTGDSERPPSKLSNVGTNRLTCIGYSEIDMYAIEIYQKHFLANKNYGDITKINPKKIPDFDLLVGGFPCQAFSIAGKRKGFKDTRGTLFFEIVRILRIKKPRLFLLENVKGLLSHDNGSTFKTIISTLTKLGYDIQWQVLNSKNFGVPQNRERVFIVGHLRGTTRPQVFPIRESSKNDIDQLNQPTHSNDRVYGTKGISPTLNTAQGGRRQPKIAPTIRANHHNTADVHFVYDDYNHRMRMDGNVGTVRATFGNEAAGNGNKIISRGFQASRIRRLTPLECERLQGFPDGWTDGVSDTQRYKCLGNAVTVNVVQAITEKLVFTRVKPK